MPVGLSPPVNLLPVKGVQLGTAAAGIRYADRDDLLLIRLAEGSRCATVYTKNRYCAAPVTLCKEHQASSIPQSLLINAGNANAGTGSQGMENAKLSCQMVADNLSLKASQVLPFSTGVIGEQLPMDAFERGIPQAVKALHEDNWLAAANAIITTDIVAKGVSKQFEIDGKQITITGISKGSGMICPNMATMLAYVATDAAISDELLQTMLVKANAQSFNRITVDSDTSTNDALVLMATGQSDLAELTDADSTQANQFYSALESVLVTLATSVIRDGEGATKFVKIKVNNGASEQDCRAIAYSVAHSPLVKTALYASDPNWGRILAAIGKAEVEQLSIDNIDIQINGIALIENGEPAASYSEQQGKEVFSQEEITIVINLNLGQANFHVWTSDLSHDYVTINADYRS